MDQVIRDLWAAELESGRYVQGIGQLHQSGGLVGKDEFCCLGVLCDIAFKAGVVTREQRLDEYHYGAASKISFLPDEVMEWAGLGSATSIVNLVITDEDGLSTNANLVDLNDSGVPFVRIAEYIRKGL